MPEVPVVIRNQGRRIADVDVRLRDAGDMNQLAQQGQRHLRRIVAAVEILVHLLMRDGINLSPIAGGEIKFDDDLLAGLVALITLALLLIGIPKQRIPGIRQRAFPGQGQHGVGDHALYHRFIRMRRLIPMFRGFITRPSRGVRIVRPNHAPRIQALGRADRGIWRVGHGQRFGRGNRNRGNGPQERATDHRQERQAPAGLSE